MTNWTDIADRCLTAPKPDDQDREELNTLSRDICEAFMPRDDYPSLGVRVSNAVVLGHVGSAIELVEHLFPGWGYQVGRPLSVRSGCGWYASVFRERRPGDDFVYGGSFSQDGKRKSSDPNRYANDPALAIMAALCRVLAAHEAGTSALAA